MKSVVFLLVLFLLPACSSVDHNNEDPAANINVSINTVSAGTPSFGDTYKIATSGNDVAAPVLKDGLLILWVSYSGGCEEHGFTLNQADGADKVQLWFNHEANSDPCEAYLTGKIEADFTQDITNDKSIELLNPNGDPFTLR